MIVTNFIFVDIIMIIIIIITSTSIMIVLFIENGVMQIHDSGMFGV